MKILTIFEPSKACYASSLLNLTKQTMMKTCQTSLLQGFGSYVFYSLVILWYKGQRIFLKTD